MMLRRCSFCSVAVKISLFKAFCTLLYTAHLLRYYKKGTMQRLTVAYTDSMRLLLKAEAAVQVKCREMSVYPCTAVIPNLMCKLSVCKFFLALTNPVVSSVECLVLSLFSYLFVFISLLWISIVLWTPMSCVLN